MLGRTFTPADTAGGTSDVIVISHGLWQRRFGGAADIIGQTVQVNGRARTVIGVMPASFRLPNDYASLRPTEAWVPEVVDPANLGAWGSRSYSGLARLKDDVSPASASSELPLVAERWVKAGYVRARPDGSLGGLARRVIPAQEFVTGQVRGSLLILFGSVGFVLLIACANVANLQLARADVRRREVAVRAALGAGRGHIVRQLLTESVLLSMAGAAAGLGVAWAGLQIVITLRPANLPRLDETALDGTVLVFTARARDRHRHPVRTAAGAAAVAARRDGRAERRRPHRHGRPIAPARAPRPRGAAARLVGRARARRGPADSQPDRAESDRSRIQSRSTC